MILNKYTIKAMDAYPIALEEAVENLEYALSYDASDIYALCLMGRLYAEQYQDYEMAKHYFQEALAVNVQALFVHMHYVDVLMWNGDFDEAQRFIDFLCTVKGIDKAQLHLKQMFLHEYNKKCKKALKSLALAKAETLNNYFFNEMDEHESRLKAKMKAKEDKKTVKKAKKQHVRFIIN